MLKVSMQPLAAKPINYLQTEQPGPPYSIIHQLINRQLTCGSALSTQGARQDGLCPRDNYATKWKKLNSADPTSHATQAKATSSPLSISTGRPPHTHSLIALPCLSAHTRSRVP